MTEDDLSEPSCAICLFSWTPEPPNESRLECRRYAPRGTKPGHADRVDWPVMKPDDWCGEFKEFK